MGVWKRRKPESGIGTGVGTGTGTGTGNGNGNGNGTGTVMWRGTNTRTGTSFTLNYFNSYSIYTKNNKKKTSLVSCSPPNLFILQQRESRKSRKQQLCECIALSVNFFTAYAQLRRKWERERRAINFIQGRSQTSEQEARFDRRRCELLGGSGGMPPQGILKSRGSEMLQPRPQGFSLKTWVGRPTHFLREKPWGRGWEMLL